MPSQVGFADALQPAASAMSFALKVFVVRVSACEKNDRRPVA
jgi:hypothetical protein